MGVPLESKGRQLLAVLWTETILSLIFVALRWYTRKFVGGRVGLDDYILAASWVLLLAFTGMITASVNYGMGVHATDLSIGEIVTGIKLLLVGQFLVAISMGLSKCAVAVFLIRIVAKLWHKILLWFWIVTIMGLSFLLAISVFAQCTPVQSIWDPRVDGVCTIDLATIAKVMCSWSAAMDFFLALFPWIVLWNLNMKRKEKITICLSLSLGVIAGICGVIRTTGLDALGETDDYLYAVSDSVMWTTSELTLTIICISMPALRPLYNRVTGGSSTGGPYHQQSNQKFSANPVSRDYKMKQMNPSTDNINNQYDVEIGRGSRNADDDSDTFILQDVDAKTTKSGGIQRHHEVTVTYEDGLSATSTKQHV
ncbi:hypothetical protein PVAG01_07852 [Phlyctema vagabunda]|uniref:Rhodopsin domain-containing protein n=1 Tax=Phlyctema vagabunda TaxID=108571 RepID=A0ABR4PDM0_9HELO